jgi:hypothetical protein
MKQLAFSCLAAGLVVFAGCSDLAGPRTMRVWGDVSFDGKPVKDGVITFEGTDDAPPAQGPIKDGKFDLPTEAGPVAEKVYLIKINAPVKTGETIPNMMPNGGPTMDVMVDSIPPVFNTNSSMKKTISSDGSKNQFTFKLMPSGAYE